LYRSKFQQFRLVEEHWNIVMMSSIPGTDYNFSNFGSLKSTETVRQFLVVSVMFLYFSNFGSLKSTETGTTVALNLSRSCISAISARWRALKPRRSGARWRRRPDFSNFGSLKSTETAAGLSVCVVEVEISAISARWRALKHP